MKSFLTLTLAFLLAIPFMSNAQRACGSMDALLEQIANDPSIATKMNEIEGHTNHFVNTYEEGARAVVTIPVVVHVVYKTNSENISDAQVLSQIDVLNEDFRRTNSDADNKWSQAADTEIEFCMATVDPSGNATNGINRVSTTKKSFRTNDDVKKTARGGVNPWPTDQYLNIWVCNLANGILGYAQFPGGSSATDGVVCLYNAFGRVGTLNNTYNLGRTTTHEVGHWLNLRHIWGDGGCSVDDFVSDTPTSDGANYNCTYTVSCGNEDMIENYMDYTNDACMNLFTQGQKARMSAVLAPGGFHYNLTQSTACSGSGPTPTCSDNIQNGDETGVDCGGSCAPCNTAPTCSDNIQNGDETGVDCGGSCAPCNTGSCDAPGNLYSQSRKGGREARLTWNAVGAANDYTVQLRQVGASSWSTATASGTQLDATGLTKNVAYEWQVRSNCGSDNSAYAGSSFTAGQSGKVTGEIVAMELFPNPARELLTIQINDLPMAATQISLGENTFENEKLTVSIIDVLGKTHMVRDIDGDSELELNVSELSNGVYFIKVQNVDGASQIERFIVSK